MSNLVPRAFPLKNGMPHPSHFLGKSPEEEVGTCRFAWDHSVISIIPYKPSPDISPPSKYIRINSIYYDVLKLD